MDKKLYLIDGTALIYRAYFAFIKNPLYNSKGENTSAIFGTVKSFIKFLEDFKPSNVAISFDRKGKTFRHEITETYKANRPPAPDELISQIAPIKQFFSDIGLEEISAEGFEADDVLATLAELNKQNFDEVIIVSGDKDFAQLVDEKVTLYDPSKKIKIDTAKINEKYGISPHQFIDYLAICGDSADNIPGVKGIGPKGAEKLLNEFESLEEIYDNLENISSKNVKQKLTDSKENAFLSQKLAKIIRDVKLDIPNRNYLFSNEKLSGGIELLKEYELDSIAKKILKIAGEKAKPKMIFSDEFVFDDQKKEIEDKFFEPILIETKARFEELLAELKTKNVVAIDTETTSIDAISAELVGISLCAEAEKAYYIPISHQMAENLELEYVLENLENCLKDKLLVAHNFKYDYHVLENSGWKISNEIFDTMIAHYLLEPSARHALDKCADAEFGYEMTPIKDLIGTGKKQITFDLVPTEQACGYAAEDANVTFRLYEVYARKLVNRQLDSLYHQIEIPLLYVLAEMENNGVFIDVKLLAQLSKKNQKRIGELTNEIYEIAGSQFNLNSTQQLAKVLFVDLGIKAVKKTKSGFSTNIEVLEKLAEEYEIARLLIEYRHLNKMESTYITALPELVNPTTGRLHSSFNQTVASTGRLSSSNPNLQNIPIRSELGKEIRKAFCAKNDDYVILAADYSQIELRVLAMVSGDEKMISAFLNGEDIHRQTASIIYKLPLNEITSDHRRYAKVINFGLMYGMGASRISKELSISRKEATTFIEQYFENFPTIKNYIQNGIEKAREYGYVSTIFGRRLYLPNLQSKNGMLRSGAERVATNMPIQGSAADIIKIAMINLYEKIKNNPDINMLIQVHDELVFEIRKDKLDEAKKLIQVEMENAISDKMAVEIPLLVDIGIGKNWFEAH